MPFSPLPATFLDDLARRAPDGVLELGCGDGTFTRLLRERGVEPMTLDHHRPPLARAVRVVGDALAPPLRPRRFGLVVAPNLLRHVWPQVATRGPEVWRDLLAPGGILYILEDEPLAHPPAARNYRDLQALLARIDPAGRRPLLARRIFEAASRRWNWPGAWRTEQADNAWPVAADTVLGWLGGRDRVPGSEADRMHWAIVDAGLSYGKMWWARWGREETI